MCLRVIWGSGQDSVERALAPCSVSRMIQESRRCFPRSGHTCAAPHLSPVLHQPLLPVPGVVGSSLDLHLPPSLGVGWGYQSQRDMTSYFQSDFSCCFSVCLSVCPPVLSAEWLSWEQSEGQFERSCLLQPPRRGCQGEGVSPGPDGPAVPQC